MAPEKKLWQDLKKTTSQKVLWTRLEAWVGAGIPDLNGVMLPDTAAPANGIEFWLELKVCKTKSLLLHSLWRPGQIAWQTARSRVCPNIFNLVSHPLGRCYYLYAGGKLSAIAEERGPCTIAPDNSPTDDERLIDIIHVIERRLKSDLVNR